MSSIVDDFYFLIAHVLDDDDRLGAVLDDDGEPMRDSEDTSAKLSSSSSGNRAADQVGSKAVETRAVLRDSTPFSSTLFSAVADSHQVEESDDLDEDIDPLA